MKPKKSTAAGGALTLRQQSALTAAEDAFTVIVGRGYEAGLDAGWLQLALWHATDRVEGLAPPAAQSDRSARGQAALTPPSRSAKVGRGRKKKTD